MNDADADEVIRFLNARMLAALSVPPVQLGPEPLRCPVCGTTRDACLRRFGSDRVHEEAIRARLREQELEQWWKL